MSRVLLILGILLVAPHILSAGPNQLGQTGFVYMPDARIPEEGTLRFGYSYYEPYPTIWSSISLFPRLEMSARYTRFMGVTGFKDKEYGKGYGDSKDKAFDAKIMLWRESKYLPAISVGTQDFLGTRLLSADYLTLSKRFSDIDVSVGYGKKRIDGIFGGIRYTPSWANSWQFLAEYDAFDYENDREASQTGADQKPGGLTLGLEYQWGWLGSQLSYQDGDIGINAHVTIPLMAKEYVPKIDEPPPYKKVTYRPTVEQWNNDTKHQQALASALEIQGYNNVRIRMQDHTLELGFSQTRIFFVGKAIGRGVRTALLMSPQYTRSIKLTYYTTTELPIVTYHFTDLEQLDQFFSGNVTYGQLLENLRVTYADPAYASEISALGRIPGVQPKGQELKLLKNDDGHAISFKSEDSELGSFRIIPFNIGIFFNDPSGAFKYDIFSIAGYKTRFARGLFLDASARLRLVENVSDVELKSNSTLPHVRSEVAEYKREGVIKLNTLIINQFLHLRHRTYARLSAGIYEEMFGGAGGQILYLPKDYNWAIDLTVDWLRQRDTAGDLGFCDYQTVTALAALHYRIKKYGVSFTLRAGRFLAKDVGGRFEFMRRFRSGIKVGAWYTITNGDDITGPGTPENPYYDKGIFMSIPLNTMLTKDTRAQPKLAMRPWTRDVGQMVKSPGDLYEIIEDALVLDRPDHHLLSDFHY